MNTHAGVVGLVVGRSSVGGSGPLLPGSKLWNMQSEKNFLNTENVNADPAHRAFTVPARSWYWTEPFSAEKRFTVPRKTSYWELPQETNNNSCKKEIEWKNNPFPILISHQDLLKRAMMFYSTPWSLLTQGYDIKHLALSVTGKNNFKNV